MSTQLKVGDKVRYFFKPKYGTVFTVEEVLPGRTFVLLRNPATRQIFCEYAMDLVLVDEKTK